MLRSILLLPLAALALAAPRHPLRAADVAAVTLAVPGRANAHASIAADGDLVVVAWSARNAAGTDVYAAASTDGGRTFAAPVRVNAVPGEAVASAERPPRVAIAGEGTARAVGVLWLGKAAAPAGPRLLLSTSVDGGRTFPRSTPLSDKDAPGIRGWASLSGDGTGRFHAAWLDGRDAAAGSAAPATAHAHHHAPAAPAAGGATAPAAPARTAPRQDLYQATIGGDTVDVTRLAADVCFCCKTAIAAPPARPGATWTPDVVVAWRHIYPNSERDIALAVRSSKGGVFARPARVSEDRWELQACPDDGPAIAMSGTGRLHAVWPTLAPGGGTPEKGIFHALTTDGRTFTPRRRLDAPGSAAAHPYVAAGADGDAIALWDELAGGSRRAVARSLADPSTPIVLGPGTYPVAAAAASGFVAAWTTGSGEAATIQVVADRVRAPSRAQREE